MIRCQFCQTTYVTNTIFCNECGSCLLEDHIPKTDPLDVDETSWMNDSIDKPAIASLSQQKSRPRAIRLKIGPGEREIEIPLLKSIHLGRLDPASAVLPEIDLTDYGAIQPKPGPIGPYKWI